MYIFLEMSHENGITRVNKKFGVYYLLCSGQSNRIIRQPPENLPPSSDERIMNASSLTPRRRSPTSPTFPDQILTGIHIWSIKHSWKETKDETRPLEAMLRSWSRCAYQRLYFTGISLATRYRLVTRYDTQA